MARTALVTNVLDFAGPPAVGALRQAGFRVLVHDDAFANGDAWAKFSAEHPGIEPIKATDPAEIVASAWSISDRIDAIVSNDHFPAVHQPVEDASIDDLRRTFEWLVVRPFALVKAAIPHLKVQHGGNVVMITSNRTRLQQPGGAIPDASRAAANALVRSLAIELAADGIAVNAIAPNYLYSEAYYPRAVFIDDAEGRAFIERNVPARRLGRPDEIGDVIRFLATTEARFLTGSIIEFSGGWPAAPARPVT